MCKVTHLLYPAGVTLRLFEQRQSIARAVSSALVAADVPPIHTEHTENHLAVARFFAEAISDVA